MQVMLLMAVQKELNSVLQLFRDSCIRQRMFFCIAAHARNVQMQPICSVVCTRCFSKCLLMFTTSPPVADKISSPSSFVRCQTAPSVL